MCTVCEIRESPSRELAIKLFDELSEQTPKVVKLLREVDSDVEALELADRELQALVFIGLHVGPTLQEAAAFERLRIAGSN